MDNYPVNRIKRGDLVVNMSQRPPVVLLKKSSGLRRRLGLILGDGPRGVLPPLVRVYSFGEIVNWYAKDVTKIK